MSPGIISDLTNRINQRLEETIIVNGDSRSRGRNEEIRNLEQNEVMTSRSQRDIRDEIERNQEVKSVDNGFFYLENLKIKIY